MDIKKILNIGIGRCGNNLVDTLMSKDSRYAGMMINSSKSDMITLKNYPRCRDYVIPHSDGTGRNRDKALQLAKSNMSGIGDEFRRYTHYELFVLYFSMDGGTGSGCVEVVAKAIRRLMPKAKIIAIGVMPDNSSSSKTGYENTIDCWSDLMQLRGVVRNGILVDKVINGFRFIDNRKRETLNEVNEAAIRDLDLSFKLSSFSVAKNKDTGKIDESDSFKFNCADDYHMTYFLNPNIRDLKEAIVKAKEQSVFLAPPTLDCDYLGALTRNNKYDETEIRSLFSVYDDCLVGESYYDEKNNTEVNVILATGMTIPTYRIEEMQVILEDMDRNRKHRNIDSGLIINRKKKNTIDEIEVVDVEYENAISSDYLDNLFDDNYWK